MLDMLLALCLLFALVRFGLTQHVQDGHRERQTDVLCQLHAIYLQRTVPQVYPDVFERKRHLVSTNATHCDMTLSQIVECDE